MEPQPFASISDSMTKSAAGVMAHIEWAANMFLGPQIKKVVILTDSPSSQYRNRLTMELMTNFCLSRSLLFEWNFFEAGHGKGAPDGVGGTLKRVADAYVATGKNILNASDFILATQHCNILTGQVCFSFLN